MSARHRPTMAHRLANWLAPTDTRPTPRGESVARLVLVLAWLLAVLALAAGLTMMAAGLASLLGLAP